MTARNGDENTSLVSVQRSDKFVLNVHWKIILQLDALRFQRIFTKPRFKKMNLSVYTDFVIAVLAEN